MWCIPPPNSSSSFEVSAIFWNGNFMTFVATLGICGIFSRNFISISMLWAIAINKNVTNFTDRAEEYCNCQCRHLGVLCLRMRHLLLSRVGPHDRGHQISIIYRCTGSLGWWLRRWWETPIDKHWTSRSPISVLNTSALSTVSSYGSISIMSIIHSDKHRQTWYVSFYLLLANSMTAFDKIGGFQIYLG